MSEFLTLPRFALLLIVLIIASFPDLILGAKTFLYRDYAFFGYPLAHYHREAFWHGQIPLWNPLSNCGIPYVAQWNTMVFYPLSLIYLLLPMPWSLGWFCLFHLFLAGLGMYCLAFRWTHDRLAASVAGIAFAFSGLTLSFLIWPNDIAALGWLPWVWLCVERGWNRGGIDVLKAAAVGAIQMLSGAPEVILFTWILLGGAWLWQFCRISAERWVRLRRIALITAVITGLAAIQLFPFLDLLAHSHGSRGTKGIWAMPVWGLANFFVPLFRGMENSMGVFMQPSQGWISSYYLGIGTLLFALTAIWKIRKPAVILLTLAFAFSLLLALGNAAHLYPTLLKAFSAFGFMRYPVKFVVIAACVVPLLAAFAVAYWKQRAHDERDASWLPLTIGATVFLFIITAIVFTSFIRPGLAENPRATLLSGVTRAALLLVTVGAWFALRKWSLPKSRRTWLLELAFIIVFWLDLISHAPSQNPTVDARAYEMELPVFAQMQPCPRVGESRALLSWGAMDRFQMTLVSNTFQAVVGFRLGLYLNCNLLEGIPKVDGFYSLYLPEEKELRFNLFPTTNSVRRGLADFLGVSQVTSDRNFLDWEGRTNWMPMLTTGQRPAFAGPAETVDKLLAEDFDPHQVVYLPLQAKNLITATNGAAATIVSQSISPHRIQTVVEAKQASMLVLAQCFYHRWKATIDQHPVPLWRANHAFQALEVPKGAHGVELVYDDHAFRLGAITSGATFLIGMGLFLGSKRSRPAVRPVQV